MRHARTYLIFREGETMTPQEPFMAVAAAFFGALAAKPIVPKPGPSPAKNLQPYNANDYVWVKLTAQGRKIHAQNFVDLFGSRPPFPYEPKAEDAKGWSQWQLWELMHEFGAHMFNGCRPCFELTFLLGGSAF